MSIENLSIGSKKELEQMVTDEMRQIEQGLSVICSNVPIDDQTNMDILCHDGDGRLVVLQLNVEEDNNMLFKGIQSLDYVEKFKSFLKATYNKHKIDEEKKPRLILVAPSFSWTLHRTVENLEGMHIDLYEWEYLKIGDHKGLRLQPFFAHRTSGTVKERKKSTKIAKKPLKIEETKVEPEEEKIEPEPSKEEFPQFPQPMKRSEEKKVEPEPEERKKRPKRKLKLF